MSDILSFSGFSGDTGDKFLGLGPTEGSWARGCSDIVIVRSGYGRTEVVKYLLSNSLRRVNQSTSQLGYPTASLGNVCILLSRYVLQFNHPKTLWRNGSHGNEITRLVIKERQFQSYVRVP